MKGLRSPIKALLAIAVLLVALAGGYWLLRGGSADARYQYAEAGRYRAQGDLRAARVALMNAVKAEPDWGDAHVALGQVALDLFDGVTARAELERASRLGVKPDAIMHLMGHAYWLEGDLDRAATVLADPALPQANRAYADRILGRVEMDRGNIDAAQAAFDRGIQAEPGNSLLWTDLARLRFVVADQKGAMDAVNHAIELNDHDVRALEFRGRLTRSQTGLVAALPWFERALKISGDDVPLLEEYGLTLGEAGRAQDMLRVARKIISLDSRNAKAYYMQAVIAARAGNYDLAKRLLPRLGRFGDLPAPMLLSGVVEYETGNVELAIEQFQRLLAMQPRNMTVRTLLARALYASGDAYGALEAIRPIASRADADSYAQMLAARSFEATGERDRAATALDAAAIHDARRMLPFDEDISIASAADEARRNPNSAPVVIPYIRLLMANGQFDVAYTEASRLAGANPGVADAHILVGDVEAARGNLGGAIIAYQRARDIRFSESVMLRLVDAFARNGSQSAAREVLNAYLANNPTSLTAQRLTAYHMLDDGKWEQAAALLEKLRARIGPNDSILLVNLARAYSEMNESEKAMRAAALAYFVDPANPMVVHIYGQVLLKSGKRAKAARELLEKAAILMPNNAQVKADLAKAKAKK